ncbi:hypothetical protein NMY22_g11979 [Coprinellus aureogranulatus]|nr:hypothetical protein NMY22_g11979 [Coprinellus aureogranulatus]
MAAPSPYAGWSREQLIERLTSLEPRASTSTEPAKVEVPPSNGTEKPKTTRKFNFYQYPRRKIALKFCYSGWDYGGLAFQIDDTPLPTVEGVLFDALAKARLIDVDAGFEGCGWERCGRTDRGVSGAGQLVSLWVRSALPKEELEESAEGPLVLPAPIPRGEEDGVPIPDGIERREPLPQSRNEHDYVSILNRMLPQTIRIIAWSPVSSKFSARFSCKWRHYKYFFSPKDLDISRMQEGASRLIGEHDFRNLCKLDPAKQITSFKRNILNAYVEQYNDNLHVFNLVGSAFLYNQVRHIMAVLFLIGTGLEPPSLISALLNASEGAEGSEYPVVDRKPEYQMADGLPLVLWDCGYPEDAFTWRTHGRPPSVEYRDDGGLQRELQNIVQRSHISAALNEHFLQAISKFHAPPPSIFPLETPEQLNERKGPQQAIQVPLGAGTSKRVIKYTRILDRKRLDPVEVANERWRTGKGFRKSEKRRLAEGGEEEPPKKIAASGDS